VEGVAKAPSLKGEDSRIGWILYQSDEAMPKQPLKRPVVTLDTSNQLGLFALQGREEVTGAPASKPKEVQFNDPDPRCILLNGVCLDEHLQRSGEKSALKVRRLLQGQCWLAFEATYAPGGRPPYAPRAMVGLILYGILRGITSLRDLERFARVDLACMWVSGGILPDHSIIGRFIQRHADYLTEEFFVSLTRQVLRVTGSDTRTVSGDGTVVEAAASRYRVVKEEALRQAVERAQQAAASAPQDEQRVRRLEQLHEAQGVLQTRKAAKQAKGKNADGMQICPGEPEAMIQPLKDKKSFAPSYKPSRLPMRRG
jgi:transposase